MYQPSFRSLIGSTATLYPFGPGGEFLRAPLASTSYSLLSGLWLDLHQLVDAHAGRTTKRLILHVRLIEKHSEFSSDNVNNYSKPFYTHISPNLSQC